MDHNLVDMCSYVEWSKTVIRVDVCSILKVVDDCSMPRFRQKKKKESFVLDSIQNDK
jgi:hypothetical protein